MKLTTAFFIFGWGFYTVAEITPLFDSVGVWATLPGAATVPLGWLAYDIMFYKPLLMLAAVPALFFLFLSFSYLRISRFESVNLYFLTTWSIILAIPDMIWPLGSVYYETLKYYFGVLSLVLAFSVILLFTYAEVTSKNEKAS
jgi:hypothetical protein